MGYPAKLLDPDEEIELDLHPHWRALVLPALLLPLTVGVGSFGAAIVPSAVAAPARIAIAVGVLVVLLLFSLRPLLRWKTTHYVVTTHRIAMRVGVVSRTGRDIPLSRINDVTYHHSLLERVFGSGTLTIESAGERGQLAFTDVPRVQSVQRVIYRLVEDDDERRRSGYGSPEQPVWRRA